MNLDITPEEFHKLIELAYLGEWMINAQHDTDFQDDSANQVLQKLLILHKTDEVGRDEETGEFFMQQKWVEQLYEKYILDYDDHVFWDELTERLAQRDLAKRRGIETEDISRDDDLIELRPLEDRYRQELEEHGVDRLELSDDF